MLPEDATGPGQLSMMSELPMTVECLQMVEMPWQPVTGWQMTEIHWHPRKGWQMTEIRWQTVSCRSSANTDMNGGEITFNLLSSVVKSTNIKWRVFQLYIPLLKIIMWCITHALGYVFQY